MASKQPVLCLGKHWQHLFFVMLQTAFVLKKIKGNCCSFTKLEEI